MHFPLHRVFYAGGVYSSPLPLEINEIDEFGFVELYPNPATDEITLSYTGEEDLIGELTIKDILGNVVLRKVLDLKHNSKLSIDVSSYNNGIYFLSIEENEKGIMKVQKFVINHNK